PLPAPKPAFGKALTGPQAGTQTAGSVSCFASRTLEAGKIGGPHPPLLSLPEGTVHASRMRDSHRDLRLALQALAGRPFSREVPDGENALVVLAGVRNG